MSCETSSCGNCAHGRQLARLGVDSNDVDYVVALAGNPNTGKSTLFNQLTGLRQHTGNWPGKTITRAEGSYSYADKRFKLVDLPGTYSLMATSADELVARDFILFGAPHVTVVVVDAMRLERNLNLCLQVLDMTPRVVICVNLMDEAKAHGVDVDCAALSDELGVPVVPTVARRGKGISSLLEAVERVATNPARQLPNSNVLPEPMWPFHAPLAARLKQMWPHLPHHNWLARRLLEGDRDLMQTIAEGRIGELDQDFGSGVMLQVSASSSQQDDQGLQVQELLDDVRRTRSKLPIQIRDQSVEHYYSQSSRIVSKCVIHSAPSQRVRLQNTVDRLLTNRITGIPIMLGMLSLVLWLTVEGANVPSAMLANILMEHENSLYHLLHRGFDSWVPAFVSGLLIDGAYLTIAWVVSVMLPPMAIFFPLFTLLEDLGYLPRIAFNLDHLFRRSGAHGKQSLCMAMGFGCNAAGVIATRIIDSPRERLIAIVTNNFSVCNGRWPTLILLSTIFVAPMLPTRLAGVAATIGVLGVALLGVALTFVISAVLSRTALKGEASTFSLELPPYRPPDILRTLYTSLIDRTLFVLWRAIVFAAPAGLVIWLISNVTIGDASIAEYAVDWLDKPASIFGLTGIILLAYVVAIPANEIVLPTILMLSATLLGIHGVGEQGAGVMFEVDGDPLKTILTKAGWTPVTALCLMLFCLCHNPCSTTIFTIWKETRSLKWTAISTFLPLALGFLLCALFAYFAPLFGLS